MNLLILVLLIIPIIIGFLIIQLIQPYQLNKPMPVFTIWKFFLAPGMGYALSSVLYFFWSVLFSPTRGLIGYFSVELLILLVLLIFAWKGSSRNQTSRSKINRDRFQISFLNIFATLVFILSLIYFLDEWQKISFERPFGDWDAWAIWNLRAGFIASGEDWLKGFSQVIAWSHPDYPLFLPLSIARVWAFIGERSVLAPMFLGLVFQLSLIGLLTTSIQIYRGYLQGLLAGSLGTLVVFVSLDFLQYADIPIAYYFLAANVFLFMGDTSSESKPSPIILAGFMIGAALWTKNEGWTLLISTIGVKLLLDLITRKTISQSAKWFGNLLIGLLPFLITTIYFKIVYAPSNDLLSSLDLASVGDKLSSIRRYWIIIRAAKNYTLTYGYLIFPMVTILLIYGIVEGLYLPKEQRHGILALSLRIAFILGIYYVIYLLTPRDLFWHISNSIDRLISQILPSILFLYFLMVSSPARIKKLSDIQI